MDIREIDLPGLGRKYALRTGEGEKVTLILHNTGHREIYLFENKAEFPTACLRLADEEARQVGAILGGAWFQPTAPADLQTVLGELTIDWVRIGPGRLPGRTIGELRIRTETGVSVIAVLRPDEPDVPNPPPETRLEEENTLVVIGSREQVEAFRRFAA